MRAVAHSAAIAGASAGSVLGMIALGGPPGTIWPATGGFLLAVGAAAVGTAVGAWARNRQEDT